MTRTELLHRFLAQNGLDTAERIALASDASARTYDRLKQNGKSYILMNAPPSENPAQFVFITELLEQAGVHPPHIFAKDLENGFLLLEDFGDNTFSRLLAQGTNELDLYRQGVQTLITLQQNIRIPDSGVPIYDAKRMLNGALFLPNWFGKYAVPGGLDDRAIKAFTQIWQPWTKRLAKLPQSLVLLDYHADNLMITPTGECGVLDYQDACVGPATYDLISLLEDERRDVSESVRQELIEDYFTGRPDIDTPEMRETLALVAMQRHTRVIGIFMRLYQRDGKSKYLNMIPFVWELVERHLNEPMFTPYREWIETHIPAHVRHTVFQGEHQQ